MLLRRTGAEVNSEAAIIGKAAFLAPEMRISPCKGMLPLIISLSMYLGLFVMFVPFFGGKSLH